MDSLHVGDIVRTDTDTIVWVITHWYMPANTGVQYRLTRIDTGLPTIIWRTRNMFDVVWCHG